MLIAVTEFWEMGHKLFKTTPETFPVSFIPADAFDSTYLAPCELPTQVPTEPLLPLPELKTLTPLVGRLSAIHTSAFFHLFPEEKQLELAKRIAPLLSPEPGSVIFGVHGGLPKKGFRDRKNSHGIYMFCHSPETWKELWEEEVFPEGQIKAEAILYERQVPGAVSSHHLVWSVTRL